MKAKFLPILLLPLLFWVGKSLGKQQEEKSILSEPEAGPSTSSLVAATSNPNAERLLATQREQIQAKNPTSRKIKTLENGDIIYEDFELDPLEKTKTTKNHSWTGEKLMSLVGIDKIAHNDFERDRYLDENNYVVDRELVYRNVVLKEVAAASGDDLPTELILPGLDGEEYEVVVTKWKRSQSPSGKDRGSITGHLRDDPESVVRWVYGGRREAGKIESIVKDVNLRFVPRQEGQVVVSEISAEALEKFDALQAEGDSKIGEIDPQGVGDPAATFLD